MSNQTQKPQTSSNQKISPEVYSKQAEKYLDNLKESFPKSVDSFLYMQEKAVDAWFAPFSKFVEANKYSWNTYGVDQSNFQNAAKIMQKSGEDYLKFMQTQSEIAKVTWKSSIQNMTTFNELLSTIGEFNQKMFETSFSKPVWNLKC